MIAVRIPKEIRSYKEKLLLGLTARQMLFVVVALLVCVPMYIFGRGFINEELLSWLVMIVAMLCASFGFIKYNGMPFERFLLAVFRWMLVHPAKRKLRHSCRFREWQETTEREDAIRDGLATRKGRKRADDEAILAAYKLLEEMIADEPGRTMRRQDPLRRRNDLQVFCKKKGDFPPKNARFR